MNKTLKWPFLNCLRGFQAAARLGSFSRAGEALHMTQSAISHQIKTLENYLEQPLFIRVYRKVTLSDAGRDLLQHDLLHGELREDWNSWFKCSASAN